MQVGDPVLVHVYRSSSGQLLAERLSAGTSAGDAGPGALGPPGAWPPVAGSGGTGSQSGGSLTTYAARSAGGGVEPLSHRPSLGDPDPGADNAPGWIPAPEEGPWASTPPSSTG
jgi:hypothetical protein